MPDPLKPEAPLPEAPLPAGPAPEIPVCSAKGCREDARWYVVWNNPKIHTPEREKVWVACDEHRDSLSEFLRIRGMFLRVDPA